MTGRFEHFDVHPGRSYRLVLAYAAAPPPLPSSSLQCCETASGQNTDRECWRENLLLSLLAVRVDREERQEAVQRHGEIRPGAALCIAVECAAVISEPGSFDRRPRKINCLALFGRPLRMSFLGVISQGRISTYPLLPCTRIRCPSGISRVASTTPTTAGKPYSRAITAPWVIRPPTSVTRPVIATNSGVQLGSV